MPPITGLKKNEKVKHMIMPSPWKYFGWYLMGVLTALWGIGIILILVTELSRRANKYYITTQRVIHEYSFLSRKTSSATFKKIQDIHLRQRLGERIFGIGDLLINTAGSSGYEIKILGVPGPLRIKRLIEDHL